MTKPVAVYTINTGFEVVPLGTDEYLRRFHTKGDTYVDDRGPRIITRNSSVKIERWPIHRVRKYSDKHDYMFPEQIEEDYIAVEPELEDILIGPYKDKIDKLQSGLDYFKSCAKKSDAETIKYKAKVKLWNDLSWWKKLIKVVKGDKL